MIPYRIVTATATGMAGLSAGRPPIGFSMLGLSVLLLLLSLTSCAVGPHYAAPEVEAPAVFESQAVLATLVSAHKEALVRQQVPVAIDWWEGFDDVMLSKLVEAALAENFEISESYARVKESEAALQLARSGSALQAALDVDASVGTEREFGGDSTTDKRGFSFLSLVQPLDLFGRTQRAKEISAADLAAARARLRGDVLRVSAEVAGRYLQIRGTQQQLLLLRESVELQEKTLDIVRSRFESGLSPELDLRRAEAAVANLRADIPPLEEELSRARHRLSTLLGEFHAVTEGSLGVSAAIPRYHAQLPQLLPLEVLRFRPDVRAAEAELQASVAAIGLAEAQWYPLVDLIGQVGLGRSGVSGAPAADLLISSITASLQQVLLDGGARTANLEAARAQSLAALARYRQSLLLAVEEVEGSLASLAASSARQASLQKAVAASERSFFQAEILYRQGLTSFLDVVDAQRVLASAQQELASAQTRYAAQIAELFRVMGTQRAVRS